MAEAARTAAHERETAFNGLLEAKPKDGLVAFVEKYLSKGHRDNPGDGCYMATLGVDAARNGPLVRAAFTEAVEKAIDMLSKVENTSVDERRRRAISDYAAMIGAIVLARAVSDETLSEEILTSVKAELLARPHATPRAARRRPAKATLAPRRTRAM